MMSFEKGLLVYHLFGHKRGYYPFYRPFHCEKNLCNNFNIINFIIFLKSSVEGQRGTPILDSKQVSIYKSGTNREIRIKSPTLWTFSSR